MAVIAENRWFYFLMVVFAFVAPLSTAAIPIVSGLLLIAWCIRGDLKGSLTKMLQNPLAIAVFIYALLQIVGLSWSIDEQSGSHKFYLLLMIPVITSVFKKEWMASTFGAFIVGMAIAEITSYYKIITGWSIHGGGGASGYSAFMTSISYGPFLVFTICLVIVSLVEKRGEGNRIWFLWMLIAAMIINLFTTGSRAGQLAFGLLMVLLVVYYFRRHWAALILMIACIPLLYWGSYMLNPAFKARVDAAVNDVTSFRANENTSVGARMRFVLNSWELIKEKPILGHGTGSFAHEYARKHTELSPTSTTTVNPHNMYILSLVHHGVIGLISLLLLFVAQFYLFSTSKEAHYRVLMMALPLLFMAICFSDSYLLGVRTQALFVLFSGVLFSNENISVEARVT